MCKLYSNLKSIWPQLYLLYGYTGYPVPTGQISGYFSASSSGSESGRKAKNYPIFKPDILDVIDLSKLVSDSILKPWFHVKIKLF